MIITLSDKRYRPSSRHANYYWKDGNAFGHVVKNPGVNSYDVVLWIEGRRAVHSGITLDHGEYVLNYYGVLNITEYEWEQKVSEPAFTI